MDLVFGEAPRERETLVGCSLFAQRQLQEFARPQLDLRALLALRKSMEWMWPVSGAVLQGRICGWMIRRFLDRLACWRGLGQFSFAQSGGRGFGKHKSGKLDGSLR